MSEREHVEGGSAYAPLSEVAAAYGVSVDTIRRRMKRGELEARKETTPQGFRWLAQLPIEPAGSSPSTAVARHEGESAAQGELIATLQRELELRNQEIARLHEIVERQALAVEQVTAALPALSSQSPAGGEAAQDAPAAVPETLWHRLRRLIRG